MTTRRAGVVASVLSCVLLLSPAAWAQQLPSAIAGAVRDTSGAVLPGVTVEASSPALIEKIRTVVTDGEGRYNIIDLRPGTYTVTFTLSGFSTFRRQGIELTAGFTATVNADMQVGAVEETITVTGATPLVDTRNVRTQSVVSNELLSALPTGNMGMTSFVALTPGMTGPAEVGGSMGAHRSMAPNIIEFRGRSGAKMNFDGMSVLNAQAAGNAAYIINSVFVEEMVLETGGISAESAASGFGFNAVPKEGGNTFRGIVSGLYTNNFLQSSNLNDTLRARGLTTTDKITRIYDGSVTLGGPIKRDRVWFFGGVRHWGNSGEIGSLYWNKTQGAMHYTPNFDRPAGRKEYYRSYGGRVTWQVSSRNKLNVFTDLQNNCACEKQTSNAPETVVPWHFFPAWLTQVRWTTTASNKLLFESAAASTIQKWPTADYIQRNGVKLSHIPITEASTGFNYNGPDEWRDPGESSRLAAQSSVTYVTGSHAYKAGFQIDLGIQNIGYVGPNISYVFLRGVPTEITQRTVPYVERNRFADLGIYVQDQWAINRLTLNYGLRYDSFNGWVLPSDTPAAAFVPARKYEAVRGVPSWNDLNPRAGASYDLFGDGRTAIKVSLARYQSKDAIALTADANPLSTSINSSNRQWSDANGNYIPDCDLTNFAANGECGAIANQNFGKINPNARRYADDVTRGFGVRPYNWDLTTEVQKELLGSVLSVTAGYYRTWSGNFRVTANEAVTPADFDPFCVTAPVDPRLPGGGGYQVCGLYNIKPAKFGQSRQVVTQASNYGEQTRTSDFVGVSFRSRLGAGILLNAGVDMGRWVEDKCFVVDSPGVVITGNVYSPNSATTIDGKRICRVVSPWAANTQIKVNGSLPLPGDFAVSGTVQNVAGTSYAATYSVRNDDVVESLGRNLAACGTRVVCTSTVTVPLVALQTLFEARRTQLDLRLSKNLDLGPGMRLRASVDIYNALNANSVLGVLSTYGPRWRKPVGSGNNTAILDARIIQISGQLNF